MKVDLKQKKKRIEQLEERISQLEKNEKYWIKEINDLETLAINKLKSPYISFEVHLSEHCNLNCKGCDHFSPLAKPEFADFEVFSKDMERMSKIFDGEAKTIHLLGGEPLLNNEVIKYLSKTRKCFKKEELTEIKIITNGILLNSMTDSFWKSCNDNKITVSVTKYPLELNYSKMMETAKKFNVDFEFYDNTDKEQIWYNIRLKMKGDKDPKRSYFKCFLANNCVMLKKGKLYTCTLVPNIEHFNKYFKKNLKISNRDYIDIYEVNDKEEILEFLTNPIPFCRYCNPDEKDYSLNWEKSKSDISEWT